MRSNKGDHILKESVLKDVQDCVNSAVDKGSCEVHTKAPIIVCLNKVLKTGLKEKSRGYWHIVQQYTHSSELDILNKFFNPTFTYQEKGITWLCYTLVEGSLLGYISSLILDVKALQRYYLDFAFLRDRFLVIKFISLLHKLSTVALSPISDGMADEFLADEKCECKKVNESFKDLQQKSSDFSGSRCSRSFVSDQHIQDDLFSLPPSDTFDLRLLPGQRQNQALPPPMTSSTASITSPVDSGVALVDSDVDNTSISELTLDNDKVEDDLPFTSMEESSIIWGESVESQVDSVANSVNTQICNDGMSFEDSFKLENTSTPVMSPVIKKMGNVDNFDFSKKDMKTSLCNDKNRFTNENQSISNENSFGDEIVFRRTKGRKTKKEKSKCVSFHEDSNKSEIKNVSFHGDNKRLSMNDDINWSLKSETSFITEDEVDKENHNNSRKDNVLLNDSSKIFIDSEVGVEVDCESNSSTVTEVSSNKKSGIYRRLNDIVKQRFESIHSKMNKSEPEIFYGSTSSLNLSRLCETSGNKPDSYRTQQKHTVHKRNSLGHMLKSIKGQWLIPVSERGVPEGQEDPQKFSSSTSLNEKCLYNVNSIDLSSDSEWSSDADECVKKRNSISYQSGHKGARRNLWPSRSLREALSKTSLVNRFLQSIPESKVNVNLALNRRIFPLYIKGVTADQELSKQLLEELEDEMKNKKLDNSSYSVEVDENLKKAIFSNIFVSSQEKIYKVYKVSSVDGLPLLCILSNSSLYITGISPVNQTFYNHHVIPYSQLNSIIIGPNSQVMMLAVTDRSHRVTVLTTFGQNMVNELLSHLELSVRRAIGTSTIAVQELSLENMIELKRMIVKQSSVQKSEDLEHYVWVNVGDSTFIPAINPLGPTKSGHLMFRPHRNSSWLPGYVLLKAGVLYVFADANQSLPNHAVPLHSGQCGGCRRVPHPSRPHTFEIILPTPGNTFQLAAADEYEVSDWLQAFVQAASGDSDSDVILDELSEAVMGCGLLLTTNHILTLSFPHKVLACAQLQYISSIKLAFNCCVLETGCREVCEGGGDWIIYFATDLALEEFLNNLVRLQPSLSDAIIMMSETDPLNIRCEQTSKLLEESWQLLLNPQIT